ncbi:MAG: glycosyltransferase family 39 protein [Flavobacteriia bacterium]|nr:glycosyltransferase family 39 protein [Flavobacteriia bacterium]
MARAATLIFLSAQTIVLSAIDLRTDALLTAFVCLALWQLIAFVQNPKPVYMLWGSLAAALAFSTKGHLALVMIGLPLLGHIWQAKAWKLFLRWELLLGLLVFCLGIGPVLYAYYLQFDLHPELVIRGRSERSGIFFILWEQSFERLSGTGMGTNSPDYFFFFHTFLWAFLPFTALAVLMLIDRFKQFKRAVHSGSGIFWGAIAVLLLISFAQFKLPHYLNSSMGVWAVLSAGYLETLYKDTVSKKLMRLLWFQRFIFFVLLGLSGGILFWMFRPEGAVFGFLFIGIAILSMWQLFKKRPLVTQFLLAGVLGCFIVNINLNGVFYPALLQYQAGTQMAIKIQEQLPDLSGKPLYKWGNAHSWALDFGLQKPLLSTLSPAALPSASYMYLNTLQLAELASGDRSFRMVLEVPRYRISRLKWSFLNPSTREAQLEKMFLIQLH